MTDLLGRADDPWQRRWAWDRRVPPRWLLVGHIGTPQYPGEDAVALCADIDGLFVDLPPRPRERFTLRSCVADGALAPLLNDRASRPSETEWSGPGKLWRAGRPGARAPRAGA